MSKLSFRARALDASKPMPIYLAGEIPDLPDFAAINRAVPQMPTGMEKEEECEHHLQRAISAQQAFGHTGELVIPTPEVLATDDDFLDQIFTLEYKAPRQLIHVQPFAMDQDIPDYDMDSEDERWFNLQARKMDITPYLFEEIMDRLEKSSGQQVVTLKEAKLLIKEDDDLIIAVYDYWLNKRLQTQHPLIPQVKTERRDGSTNNNPYVAFRRRTEKMQTRKNRKNDEASYEKMLKLKRDLNRASLLFDMVKRREKTKREHLHLSIEVFEKRYQMGDFTGQILAEVQAMKNHQPAPLVPIRNNKQPTITIKQEPRQATANFKPEEIVSTPRKKREYNKRKHKVAGVQGAVANRGVNQSQAKAFYEPMSSEEEGLSPGTPPSDQDDENDPDGPYAFKRKRNCYYLAPRADFGGWPWENPWEGGLGHKKYRFCLTTISAHPYPRTIGFARQRIGRGGRIIFDRAYTPLDEDYSWDDIASVDISSSSSLPISSSSFLQEIHAEWVHFRPHTSPQPPPPPPPPRCSSGTHCNNNPTSSVPETSKNYPPPSQTTQTSNIDLESFQTHQEELFEMQRKQLERLKQEEVNNGQGSSNTSFPSPATSASVSSQPLDPASVQFAVSALLNSNEVPSIINSSVSSSSNCVPNRTNTFSLANGPKDERPDHQTVILKSSKDDTLERPPPNSFIQITLPHEVSSSQLPACIRVLPSSDPVTNGSSHRSLPAPKLTLAATTDLRLLAAQHHPTSEHNGEGQLFSYNEESNSLVKIRLENVKDTSGYAADVT